MKRKKSIENKKRKKSIENKKRKSFEKKVANGQCAAAILNFNGAMHYCNGAKSALHSNCAIVLKRFFWKEIRKSFEKKVTS